MTIPNVAGYWTGEITGTNQGGVTFDIKQDGRKLSGIANMHEPALGQYEYNFEGTIEDKLYLSLTPGIRTGGLNLGRIKVIGELIEDGKVTGMWKSDIGTEGVFEATRYEAEKLKSKLPKTNSVFLVHGHDEGAKHSVARFLEQIGVEPVILQEQLNRGMTVIEKFEDFASRAGFAVVLMTPDDFGYPSGKEEDKKSRPRQNVILELGYFTAKLGRSHTLVLVKGDIEMPSDVFGLVYEPMESNDGWKMRLARELKAAGFEIDMNKAIN